LPTVETICMILFVGIALLTAAKLFSIPIRWIFRFLCNTALGFVLLAVCEHYHTYLPFTLGFNMLNAAVIGVFGIPGFLLLLLIRWLFGG